MDQLSLFKCLQIEPPALVSFYGAGGKTSLMLKLAGELAAKGHKTLVTTTTKIYPPRDLPLFLDLEPAALQQTLKEHFQHSNLAALGSGITAQGKLAGLAPGRVDALSEELPVSILVEADGSRGRPLKGYRDFEPVLPQRSGLVAAVIGGDAIGGRVDAATVHRPVEFLKALGAGITETISEKTVASAFEMMRALGKRQVPGAKAVYFLNKADLLDQPGPVALNLCGQLCALNPLSPRLMLTDAAAKYPVLFNLDPAGGASAVSVSCVLVAAGSSVRMGRDKLLLPLRGRTIFEQTLSRIEEAGFSEIIVVIRPDSALRELPALSKHRVVVNRFHYRGLASSLQAGIREVDSGSQGVLFALADQPLVSSAVYRKLVTCYRKNLKEATIPVHGGRRGNPVLFDRRTWADLCRLSGDRGGRAVLERLPTSKVDPVEVEDSSIFADIDTPEDYRLLSRHVASRRLQT